MFPLFQRKRKRTRAEKVRDALVTLSAKLATKGAAAARNAVVSASDTTRQAATQVGGTARERTSSTVLPKLSAARDTTRKRVTNDVAPKVAAGVTAARSKVRDRLSSPSGDASDVPVAVVAGPQAEKVVDEVGRGAAVLTDVDDLPEDLQDKLRSGGRRRGRLLLLLALAGGAAYAYRKYSSGQRSDSSWDLAAAPAPVPSSQSSTTQVEHRIDLTSAAGTESVSANRTVVAPATAGGQATSGEGSLGTETRMTGDAEEFDLPGDPSRVDVTAASHTPASLRSDEGPGISDTDDATRRSAAGDAGADAFGRVASTDDSRT